MSLEALPNLSYLTVAYLTSEVRNMIQVEYAGKSIASDVATHKPLCTFAVRGTVRELETVMGRVRESGGCERGSIQRAISRHCYRFLSRLSYSAIQYVTDCDAAIVVNSESGQRMGKAFDSGSRDGALIGRPITAYHVMTLYNCTVAQCIAITGSKPYAESEYEPLKALERDNAANLSTEALRHCVLRIEAEIRSRQESHANAMRHGKRAIAECIASIIAILETQLVDARYRLAEREADTQYDATAAPTLVTVDRLSRSAVNRANVLKRHQARDAAKTANAVAKAKNTRLGNVGEPIAEPDTTQLRECEETASVQYYRNSNRRQQAERVGSNEDAEYDNTADALQVYRVKQPITFDGAPETPYIPKPWALRD